MKAKEPGAVDLVGQEYLEVSGARVHNLKNMDIRIPRNQLVVITGISGSGKSSLAFDTIYAEGQRRYMESFSAYARQFIGGMERPDVDNISGLSPVVSIEQKSTSKNPRSTVGTITEIYDFIRLLYARAADAYSYNSGKKMEKFSEDQMMQNMLIKHRDKKMVILAPVVKGRKGHYRELFEDLRKKGFLKARVDGEIREIAVRMQLDRYKIHDVEIVVDRLKINEDAADRIRQSIQLALKMGDGLLQLMDLDSQEIFAFSQKLMCPDTGLAYEDPNPNSFSFNSPYGACPHCKGLGIIQSMDIEAVIPDLNKSIHEGGITAVGEYRDNGIFRELKSMAKKHKFSLSEPLKRLSKENLNLILYGKEELASESSDISEDGEETTSTSLLRAAEEDDSWYSLDNGGLQGMLKRCFGSTSSDGIRHWAEQFMIQNPCPSCQGYRLKKESLWFKIRERHIGELSRWSILELHSWFANLEEYLNDKQKQIAVDVLKEIRNRIQFLLDVGLGYLSLDRQSRSLSGGEAQRIRLATQIGSQLSGVTYILDEPSIGLHQRDNHQLIHALKELVKIGNSVLVVEHDKDIMLHSDYIFDLGPKAGKFGGELVAEGKPKDFLKKNSLTAQFLNRERNIVVPKNRRAGNGQELVLHEASGHNLKNIHVRFPLASMICVTGVSGSGKSSLITETLYPILSRHFYHSRKKPLPYKKIEGLQHLDKVIEIDQSPIGRTPRSNPATYIKVFDEIRQLFAQMPEALIRGYKPGRFSFNVKGGRCEECQGGGLKTIEMNFLPPVYVPCDKCLGKRYNRETLEVRYKGKSIHDVLEMSVDEAVEFFDMMQHIQRKIKSLQEVGLGYLTLGQSSTTISGGEAQRVKLASELSKRDTGNTFYILDEPTTGLHFEDIRLLMDVLNTLVDKGNTVLIIEHNLDVIKMADHIIDMGPEGGDAGGTIIAEGKPESILNNSRSHTARYLKEELLH